MTTSPTEREQQARGVLAATPHAPECPQNPNSWSWRNRGNCDPYPCQCNRTERAMLAFADAPRPESAAPVDMLLFCPKCGLQHIDEPEHVLVWTGGSVPEPSHDEVVWDNPPHRSHLCHGCGCIWRPADVPTNGVARIATQGKADTWGETNSAAVPARPTQVAESREAIVRLHTLLSTLKATDFRNPDIGAAYEQEAVEIDAILAALSQHDGEGWWPIETAPKDGAVVLVCDINARTPQAGEAQWFDGEWRGFDYDMGVEASWPNPTHWRPLPTPPIAEEGD